MAMLDRMFDRLERNMATSQYVFDCVCTAIFLGSGLTIWAMMS
jgi:hypothetical protein